MDREILSILLYFMLYCVFFLVPLIPSILIYKIFPNTSVSTRGQLANFKINTSGAFAAYLATVLIGITTLSDIQTRILSIKNPTAPTWTITGNLELRDFEGNLVQQPKLFDQVCVSIKPEIFTSANGDIHFKIPGTNEGKIPQRMITIDITGFGRGKINLTALNTGADNEVVIDYGRKIIGFRKPIVVRSLNDPARPYMPKEYMR